MSNITTYIQQRILDPKGIEKIKHVKTSASTVSFSAVTVNGDVTVKDAVYSDIFSGDTQQAVYYGDGSNLKGISDFYVTGGTFDRSDIGTLTLNRNDGNSIDITGFTKQRTDKKVFKPNDLSNIDTHGQVLGTSYNVLDSLTYNVSENGDYEFKFDGYFDMDPNAVTAINIHLNNSGLTDNYKEVGVSNGPKNADSHKVSCGINDIITCSSGDTIEVKAKILEGNNSEFKIGKLIIKKI